MKSSEQYRGYRKPSWAPPSWLFAPVWTLLYAIIAVSFGYVGYLWVSDRIGFMIALPFLFNLVFNAAFTPILFRWRKFFLAAIDVILVLLTLLWALFVIFPIAPWIAYANVPYLLWTTFASVLQITVTAMNRRESI